MPKRKYEKKDFIYFQYKIIDLYDNELIDTDEVINLMLLNRFINIKNENKKSKKKEYRDRVKIPFNSTWKESQHILEEAMIKRIKRKTRTKELLAA